MTKSQFINNNRGIDGGKDLPTEFLEDLYDKICTNEIHMDYERDDMVTWFFLKIQKFCKICRDLQGYLQMQEIEFGVIKGLNIRKWHRRW